MSREAYAEEARRLAQIKIRSRVVGIMGAALLAISILDAAFHLPEFYVGLHALVIIVVGANYLYATRNDSCDGCQDCGEYQELGERTKQHADKLSGQDVNKHG